MEGIDREDTLKLYDKILTGTRLCSQFSGMHCQKEREIATLGRNSPHDWEI